MCPAALTPPRLPSPVSQTHMHPHTPPPAGILSLSAYLRFWGWAYLAITAAVALLTREHRFGGGAQQQGQNGE